MKFKKYTFIIVIFSIFQFGFSQNSNEKIWDLLLKNDRETALNLVRKINEKKASIEQLILKQKVLQENGLFKHNEKFYTNFVKKENFEYYLFSLWNEQFIFKEYLTQSFDKKIRDNVQIFKNADIKNKSITAGLQYLDAILDRNHNDFDSYNKKIKNLNAISNWQYCSVFENLNKSGLDIVYPPENNAFSSTSFNANSNGYINWFTPKYNIDAAYQFMSNHTEYGSGINYAQTFFNLKEAQTLIFKLGIGKATKLWLNDVLIFEESKNRITELDAHTIKVSIPKGNNRILIKTTNDYYSYFILRVFNENNELINPKKLNFTSNYSKYNRSEKSELNVVLKPNSIESFFKNLNSKKYSAFFKDYMLIRTYLRNSKVKPAKKIILSYLEKYPKSSLLRSLLIKCATIEKEYTLIKELKENRKNDDPNNYIVLLENFVELDKLFKLPIDEMDKKLDLIGNSTDLIMMKKSAALFKYFRKNDNDNIKIALNEIYQLASELENSKLLNVYAKLYTDVFKENDKTLELLTQINEKYFYYTTYINLIINYDKLNNKEEVIRLYKEIIGKLPKDLELIKRFISKLHSYKKYEESLEFIDKGLKYFPYSFKLMSFKGDALIQLEKEKEALFWYKKSFSHDSGNSSLRKTIQDLEKTKDPIEQIAIKEPYEFIAKNRNKTTSKEYGLKILLDEVNIQIYKEGGYRNRSIYIYEVLTEDGVETLKEYNLNLSRPYTVNKSEIVKPDGSLVPAERSGSSLVFNNLSVGDVILVDFDTSTNKTGRFYKDYTNSLQISSYYPSYKSDYRIIVQKGEQIITKITNGNIPYSKETIGDFTVHKWSQIDGTVIKPYEDYMPEDNDIATTLHVSTIDSWSQISNWYSDLVRSQIEYNNTVNDLFNKLFPNGYKNLDEEERAKIIYYYMMNNLTYSFVNFKQSGFVPQKPSKTIKTLLGDCKDFSTLFLILAKKAGLKTNLVLIATNDLGSKSLVLPSTDFNHCIARVLLDGNEQYLELTDKNLPFKTLPQSLDGALALNIPYNSNNSNKNDLFVLKDLNKKKAVLKVDVDLIIENQKQSLKIAHKTYGSLSSFYKDLLSETNQSALEKSIEKYYENRENLDLTLNNLKIDKNIKKDDEVIFTTDFTVNNEVKKLGKFKLLKLPDFANAYTNDIINLEKRNHPLIYNKYENVDIYETNYTIVLKDNQKFYEIPENQVVTFKEHHFEIKYILENDAKLIVKIKVLIDKSNILQNEYNDYKEYVRKVIDVLETFIGFK